MGVRVYAYLGGTKTKQSEIVAVERATEIVKNASLKCKTYVGDMDIDEQQLLRSHLLEIVNE